MARHVAIKKYKNIGNLIYYRVSTLDFPNVAPFFIGIDAKSRSLLFFKSESLDTPSYVIDLENKEQKIHVDWLPNPVTYFVCRQVIEAIGKGSFPDDISYCA